MIMRPDKKDHAQLICDIGELSGLFKDSMSLEAFLQETVKMVARHMDSHVCSIYLFYEDSEDLVLRATTGLNPNFIGNVKLKLHEGLTGLAMKELRPICECNASKNSNFRYFPGLGEEQYESFLAIPMTRGTTRIGVMVVQNTASDYFSEEDVKVLRAITSQLANTIEMTKLFLSLGEKVEPSKRSVVGNDLKFIKGKVGSPGFALADAFIITEAAGMAPYCQEPLEQYTLEDFQSALRTTEEQLKNLEKQGEEKLSDVAALIFSAQILMLKDKSLIDSITRLISGGLNPVRAVVQVVDGCLQRFDSISNGYLKERKQDVLDAWKRLLGNLMGKGHEIQGSQGRIVIASELFASDILKLSLEGVQGIILLSGGVTSHLSILARSLQIPLIIAEDSRLLCLPQKTNILMDAEQGNIYIRPSQEIITTFKSREDASRATLRLKNKMSPETYTRDGRRILLMANINLLGDLRLAKDFQAEGIGLYRTEFPYIIRNDFPGEEELAFLYQKLVRGMPGKEITFRTLDIGGDKILSYFEDHAKEANPFLGMRSIRFSLKHQDIFSQQIRSILRAGHDIRIMFPMISSLDEFLEARGIVWECIASLKKERIPLQENPKIGMMVELPAVLEIINELAVEADFFSIGTNDFIQYMLAVDRTNEKVADLYLAHHPAVLRSLKKIVEAAKTHDKDISICGDMVHEEKYLRYLLGIGIRKLSLNPVAIPKTQTAIRSIDMQEARESVSGIIEAKTIEDLFQKFMGKSYS